MADNPFEAMWKGANASFLSAFGRDGGLTYVPQAGGSKVIAAIPVDEKPITRLAPSGTMEFEEWRWRISSANNTEGHVDVKVMGFKGQAGDTVTGLNGKTWYVVYFDAGNDPGMQIITLRDKGIPWDYDNE